jgi:AraC-like DNA-binding protein
LRIDRNVRLIRSSKGLGWTDLFAAETDELPHQSLRGVVPSVWIVTADTPNAIDRVDGDNERFKKVLQEKAISVTPSGAAVYDELALPLKARHLYLRQSLIDDVAAEVFHDGRERRFVASSFGKDDPILYQLISAILVSLDGPESSNRLKVDFLTSALAAHLLTHHSVVERPDRPVPLHVFNASQLGIIVDYIGENLASDLSIDDLAQLTGLGRVQFIQRFRATTTTTPYQFVIKRRIKEARKLLANPSIDYAKIALTCGFADQSHFIATFKQHTGLTPQEYRKIIVS